MLEFEKLSTLKAYIEGVSEIENIALQGLNLTPIEQLILQKKFKDCLFMGCIMSENLMQHLANNNLLLPRFNLPFKAYPNQLYSPFNLYNEFDRHHPETIKKTFDQKVYNHYINSGKQYADIKNTLAQSIHDQSISDALYEFLEEYELKKRVAIMGGHRVLRNDPIFRQIAFLSKELTEKGWLIISGGGPGAMEASHLGAWFAGKKNEELDEALNILQAALTYQDPLWLSSAFEVLERFPNPKYKSLGIPTWHYGHEPSTPFATHIAKFFQNSIREDGLLAIALGGVIFSPGSFGTIQEVFQDLAQNYYVSYGLVSPMIFLDKKFWTEERPIYPVIKSMFKKDKNKVLDIELYDRNEDIIKHLTHFAAKPLS